MLLCLWKKTPVISCYIYNLFLWERDLLDMLASYPLAPIYGLFLANRESVQNVSAPCCCRSVLTMHTLQEQAPYYITRPSAIIFSLAGMTRASLLVGYLRLIFQLLMLCTVAWDRNTENDQSASISTEEARAFLEKIKKNSQTTVKRGLAEITIGYQASTGFDGLPLQQPDLDHSTWG